MPGFVNENAHAVRVQDDEGNLRRITANEVVEADGGFADRLSNTAGVSKASDSDVKAYRESLREQPAGDTPGQRAKRSITASRMSLRHVTVAGPLRRVVGDDAAPHGPGSGTITTKAAVASKGPVERQAFADHEALPGEKVDEADPAPGRTASESVIHNAQADNAEAAEKVAKDLVGDQKSAGPLPENEGGAADDKKSAKKK